MTEWVRFRFQAEHDDSRPIKFPPPGPWWETALACNGDFATVVAYFPKERQGELWDYWPEANEITKTDEKEIIFTSRFPCPEWWENKNDSSLPPPVNRSDIGKRKTYEELQLELGKAVLESLEYFYRKDKQ